MSIAVVAVKLKVFPVLRIDSASMNSHFGEDFGPFSNYGLTLLTLSRGSTLAKQTLLKKTPEGFEFS